MKMAVARNKDHVWKTMSGDELLRSSGLILTDSETKREEITLAAILLFGKDNSIMSVLPQHKTDAFFRVENNKEFHIFGYEKTALGLSAVLII